MSPTQLFVLHVALFAAVPIGLAAWRSSISTTLLYAYMVTVLFLGGFLGSLYAFPLFGDVVISGGAIAYAALVFTVIVLVVTARDLQVIRDTAQMVVVVNVFKLAYFGVAADSLRSSGAVNRFDTAPEVFDTSIRVVTIGGLLIIVELVLLVVAFERIKAQKSITSLGSLSYVVTFAGVLALDGVLFPMLNSPTAANLSDLVIEGVREKLVLAAAFTVPMVLFLGLFRERVAMFAAQPLDIRHLLRASDAALVREIERQKAALEYQSRHDGMTGLANRMELVDRIESILRRAHPRSKGQVAVICIDIDDFKLVNDGHGHAVGDAVLVSVGERILLELRDGDVAARLGGDEFAALVTEIKEPDEAVEVAERILAAIREPVPVDGVLVSLRVSIGVASTPLADAVTAEHLVRNANLAMYQAKGVGRNGLEVFTSDFQDQAQARAELVAEIDRSIESGDFTVHYQPIVDLASGQLAGLEALLRWDHPERGLLGPDDFIGRAEESQSIVIVGAQVLEQACRDCAEWLDLGCGPVGVSVNVSARQLRDPDLVPQVTSILEASGLDPALLTLEITESGLAVDVNGSVGVFEELKRLGVKISIDDFGTGFSSLAYLHQLPADILKIDKTFVDRINEPGSHTGRPLAESIIGLGEVMSLKVVAEGVETAEQCATLRDLGCGYGQGYYFSPAMPAHAVATLLAGSGCSGYVELPTG